MINIKENKFPMQAKMAFKPLAQVLSKSCFWEHTPIFINYEKNKLQVIGN